MSRGEQAERARARGAPIIIAIARLGFAGRAQQLRPSRPSPRIRNTDAALFRYLVK
jgi:hypothetical protein